MVNLVEKSNQSLHSVEETSPSHLNFDTKNKLLYTQLLHSIDRAGSSQGDRTTLDRRVSIEKPSSIKPENMISIHEGDDLMSNNTPLPPTMNMNQFLNANIKISKEYIVSKEKPINPA